MKKKWSFRSEYTDKFGRHNTYMSGKNVYDTEEEAEKQMNIYIESLRSVLVEVLSKKVFEAEDK